MMKPIAMLLCLCFLLVGCAKTPQAPDAAEENLVSNGIPTEDAPLEEPPSESRGQIFLYGEQHGDEQILSKELELWSDYYHNEQFRHLFVELPYFTAEFLNLWMQAGDDTILDAVYADWEGSASHDPAVKAFYQKIKTDYPETIFHGTDIGHQYYLTGERYLAYLEVNGLGDAPAYALAQEAMEQGTVFYRDRDYAYRENQMVVNFIRAFEELGGESIMGIYGSAHTWTDAMDSTNSVPCMANQLMQRFGDAVHTEDLSWMARDLEPVRVDTIAVGGKDYEAPYFGEQDISWAHGYSHREFWRLEDAYDDWKDAPKEESVLPYDNYPMAVEAGQVFVVDYTRTDGSVTRMYFRSDGNSWQGKPATEEFVVD